MGNTQVTPIRPAIPPLINLAGKLEEDKDQDEKGKKCGVSIDKKQKQVLLQTSVTLPDLLVSHLSKALTGQSSTCLLAGWLVAGILWLLSSRDCVAGLPSVHLTSYSC